MSTSFELATPHRRTLQIELSMNPQWYGDLTGAQHLVALFVYLLSGRPVKPSEYARLIGITRPAVYHQMRQLSQMGIPVVRAKYGHWTLMQFVSREEPMLPGAIPTPTSYSWEPA